MTTSTRTSRGPV